MQRDDEENTLTLKQCRVGILTIILHTPINIKGKFKQKRRCTITIIMKKLLLSAALLAATFTSANAEWLQVPVITGEQVNKDNVMITWTPVTDPDCTYIYEVLVYKMHKANADEYITLLDENFDYIESTGTMQDYEHGKGYVWDEIKNAPGWTVKSPTYMNGAIGYDAWMNYAGNDNDDIFAGAYILSPQLDLSNVTSRNVRVECKMAQMGHSSTGVITIYTWSQDLGMQPDYSIVGGQLNMINDLTNTGWKDVDVMLHGDKWCSNSRISITSPAQCYSPIWVDDLKVTVGLAKGDKMPIPAQQFTVTDGNSITIDTSDNTDNDSYYAYQVRTVYMDPSDGAFRAYSQYTDMKLIGEPLSVKNVTDNSNAGVIKETYSINGTKTSQLNKGVNIVKMTDGSVRKIMK